MGSVALLSLSLHSADHTAFDLDIQIVHCWCFVGIVVVVVVVVVVEMKTVEIVVHPYFDVVEPYFVDPYFVVAASYLAEKIVVDLDSSQTKLENTTLSLCMMYLRPGLNTYDRPTQNAVLQVVWLQNDHFVHKDPDFIRFQRNHTDEYQITHYKRLSMVMQMHMTFDNFILFSVKINTYIHLSECIMSFVT